MRIRNIKIRQWRHFENIELDLNEDANLVCVVGANGTGKSHLLELIAACAHRLGLSQGVEIPRGDPFSDVHDFELKFHLAKGVSQAIDDGLRHDQSFAQWDRSLRLESCKTDARNFFKIEAGGITDERTSASFAERVTNELRQSKDVYFLSLDADRAYPKRSIEVHQIAQAYEIDWEGPEYTRGRSFRPSSTLYDEWIKYFLAQENQSGTRLIQKIRRSRKSGANAPDFVDHFDAYALAVQKVLPHVLFTGVDSKRRTLLFDTTGLELSFDQLSGGEREIAFLVGQIDRFGLREGLFLLDEPELHLNADLIRTWILYLMSTVSTGQIWLATHSLEAVEAAGLHATFVLERNEGTRKVDSLSRLDTKPVLSALSRAVGTPAFSISQLVFVFVEGEEDIGERERFRNLAGNAQDLRFIEGGSCNEVLRRLETIKTLADASNAAIRIGGVIDRDFRSESESNELATTRGVFVLPVHEAENFLLHVETLDCLLRQNGRLELNARDLIRDAADNRAGCWIFQHAMATRNAQAFPEIPATAKEQAKAITWTELLADRDVALRGVIDATNYGADDKLKFQRILETSVDIYSRKREEDDLWAVCEGKQVLNEVARAAGFAGAPALELAAIAAWQRDTRLVPSGIVEFREYLATL